MTKCHVLLEVVEFSYADETHKEFLFLVLLTSLYIFTPGSPSIADCERSAEDFCGKERKFFVTKSEVTFNASNQDVTSVGLPPLKKILNLF